MQKYSYDEILDWIEKDNITIWDLAIKLGFSLSDHKKVNNILNTICKNNSSKVTQLKNRLKKNSKEYAKQNVDKSKKLDYNKLVHLANNGYNINQILKMFGYYTYQTYTNAVNKMLSVEKIDKDTLNTIKKKITYNKERKHVNILPNKAKSTNNTETSKEDYSICSVDLEKKQKPSIKNYSNKVVIYSYEYLKNSNFQEELDICEDEKILLSSTFTLFMRDKRIRDTRKIDLSNAINNPKYNLRIVPNYTQYSFEVSQEDENMLSVENDMLISYALMLSSNIDKDIYIAVNSNFTALNALQIGLGIRFYKRYIDESLCKYAKKDTLTYVDYKLEDSDQFINFSQDKSYYVLDTCVLIGNSPSTFDEERDFARYQILNNTSEEKIIFKAILKELKYSKSFFSTLYVSKYNPTVKICLDFDFEYTYTDLALLNTSLYLKKKYKLDITLLTFDFSLYLEALQFNLKSIYYKDKWKNDPDTIDNTQNPKHIKQTQYVQPKRHKTLEFSNIKETNILKHNPKVEKVMKKFTQKEIPLQYYASCYEDFKYYVVSKGDLIKLKGDPNIYSIIKFDGLNNIVSS